MFYLSKAEDNQTGHSTPNRDEYLLLQSKKKESKRNKQAISMPRLAYARRGWGGGGGKAFPKILVCLALRQRFDFNCYLNISNCKNQAPEVDTAIGFNTGTVEPYPACMFLRLQSLLFILSVDSFISSAFPGFKKTPQRLVLNRRIDKMTRTTKSCHVNVSCQMYSTFSVDYDSF